MENKILKKINRSSWKSICFCWTMFFCFVKENNIIADCLFTTPHPFDFSTLVRETGTLYIAGRYLRKLYQYARGASVVLNPLYAIPTLGYLGGKQILDEYRATKLNHPNLTPEQIDEILKYSITEGKNNVVIRKRLEKIERHRQTMSNLEKKNEKLFFEQHPDLLRQYFEDPDLFNYGKGALKASGDIFTLASIGYKWDIFKIMSYLSRLEKMLPHITRKQFESLLRSKLLIPSNKNTDHIIQKAILDIREKFSKIENNDQKIERFFYAINKNFPREEIEKLLTFGREVVNSKVIDEILKTPSLALYDDWGRVNTLNNKYVLGKYVLGAIQAPFFKDFPNVLDGYFEDAFKDYMPSSDYFFSATYPSNVDSQKISHTIYLKLRKLYSLIREDHITREQANHLINKIVQDAINNGEASAEDMEAIKTHMLNFANQKEEKAKSSSWYQSTAAKALAAAGLVGAAVWKFIKGKKDKNKKDEKKDEKTSSQETGTQE